MKKRIKRRCLTNIYHSDDDDVGNGYNLLPPLSLSVPLPLRKTGVSSHIVLIFLSTVFWLAFAIGYSQKRDFNWDQTKYVCLKLMDDFLFILNNIDRVIGRAGHE